MNTPWRIEMLGWLRAQSDDLTLTRFRTRKTALLLARLALPPQRAHPREELADLLWPDADLEAGRNNLKQSLAILRRLLEPPGTPVGSVLIADRLVVRLNPASVTTDVAEFQAALAAAGRLSRTDRTKPLRQAAALYRGDLLPGFYDDWVIEERERLVALREEAQEQIGEPAQAENEVQAKTADETAEPASAAEPAPAPPAVPGLPMQFTRFFGRGHERKELAVLLADPSIRLVTLTGPGGTGKTRLALESARQAAAGLGGRVHFVPLADLADPGLILDAVADALGLARTSLGAALDRVAAALGAAPALLLLDNLEQLGEGAAAPVLALLTRVPCLTVLATSRARLFVAGEREYPLAPLPTPQEDAPGAGAVSPESLLGFPGVQLFADRAQAARPDFQVTPRNAPAVADVCRRLEGIPLALELAAAWSALLTPAQMRDRLGERFTLLRSRRKDVAERHQTLWEAISWSYALLPPDLARFWARLSVFRGGWTADAAQAVCAQPGALDALGRLRARSLVTVEEAGDEMRFRLLESLREFGGAQLTADERGGLADNHAHYFVDLAEKAEPQMTGPEQIPWLERLTQEQDNLRAALDWDATAAGDGARGLRLAGALWRFWSIRGPLSEGRRRLEQALERFEPAGSAGTAAEARALNGLAVLTRRQGDMAMAGERQRRCLAIWRTLGDARGIASSLNNLGTLATLEGDYAQAEPLLTESLALWRALGQGVAVAQTLNNLGFLAHERDDFVTARAYCEESLALFRRLGDTRGATLSLSVLAMAAAELGEYALAKSLCADVFRTAGEMNDAQTTVGGLAVLGQSAIAQDAPERAARLLGAAQALRDTFGSYQDARAQAKAQGAVEAARRALPLPVFEAAWAEGQAMSAEQAVAYGLEERG